MDFVEVKQRVGGAGPETVLNSSLHHTLTLYGQVSSHAVSLATLMLLGRQSCTTA